MWKILTIMSTRLVIYSYFNVFSNVLKKLDSVILIIKIVMKL